ncbi:MAG: hypothetical protein IJT08_01415 [Alphaproteobacteria bacterium]|nr:hypothetical protein [Alphaproteobacteria bacterium]
MEKLCWSEKAVDILLASAECGRVRRCSEGEDKTVFGCEEETRLKAEMDANRSWEIFISKT